MKRPTRERDMPIFLESFCCLRTSIKKLRILAPKNRATDLKLKKIWQRNSLEPFIYSFFIILITSFGASIGT